MADTPYLGQTIDVVLGQEYLTWLWFRSETRSGQFQTPDGDPYFLYVEQRVSVQGGEGETLETATVSGNLSELREARLGLSTGKKVNRALIRIEHDPEAWQLSLKAEDFALGGLKTPKVEKADSEDDDPDAAFLEKMFLIEKCLTYLDASYNDFLNVRLAPEWDDEVRQIGRWLEMAE
ncbi:hypothetical protein LN040_05550 [Desulfovibrio subterraneus]|jgi:hypothetical protein|uniref:hypothetical protein n=1 Tax=Desulfovibrio subterraneus TaxID=2718620 RepID=UPI0022B8F8AB|nr:hypothetical protein [Desulfovibrio subterraneus]WBF68567.1 hypothetical protein LN040_05550 [Desulfovibrio subterraneus]